MKVLPIISLLKSIFAISLVAISLIGFTANVSAAEKSPENEVITQQSIVNINSANPEELSAVLTGVGEKKAQAIVSYRLENGAFTSIDDLLNVKGIGESTIAKNRHRIQL